MIFYSTDIILRILRNCKKQQEIGYFCGVVGGFSFLKVSFILKSIEICSTKAKTSLHDAEHILFISNSNSIISLIIE